MHADIPWRIYIYIYIGVCDAPCLDGRDAVVVDLKKRWGGEIICTSVITREEMQLRSKIGPLFSLILFLVLGPALVPALGLGPYSNFRSPTRIPIPRERRSQNFVRGGPAGVDGWVRWMVGKVTRATYTPNGVSRATFKRPGGAFSFQCSGSASRRARGGYESGLSYEPSQREAPE